MFTSVLVVCVGNICRSPVGERLLARALPELRIASAGLGALVGQGADQTMSDVAAAQGLALEGHVARQFTDDLGRQFDLILAMEPGHKREIFRVAPQLSGRTLLFDQWSGAHGIEDPYRRDRLIHEAVFSRIASAAEAWAEKLDREAIER